MNHTDLLKQALSITWRYRALWIFGFLLALCGGGGGGGGGGNFSPPGGGGDGGDFSGFGDMPGLPSIDTNTIIAIVVGIICLILLLTVLSVLVQVITRTALIGMVRQITETESVTVANGWRLGWSRKGWRLFLADLIIGLPWTIVSVTLVLLAFSPLLLILTDNTGLIVVGVILTVFGFLFVLLILLVVGAIVGLFQELVRRRVVLDSSGVIASLGETVGLIRRHLKDVFIIWLLMFGVGLVWAIVTFIAVLPVALIAAALLGGIPALLVYLISESWVGAAVAGVPLGVLALILVTSIATGFYLIFRSSVWTLAYLEFQEQESEESAGTASATPPLEPQPEA